MHNSGVRECQMAERAKMRNFLVVAFVFSCLIGIRFKALAGDTPKDYLRVEGTIKRIDSKEKQILFKGRTASKNHPGNWFFFNEKTEIYILGKKAKLTDLKIGDPVLFLCKRLPLPSGGGFNRLVCRIVKIETLKKK